MVKIKGFEYYPGARKYKVVTAEPELFKKVMKAKLSVLREIARSISKYALIVSTPYMETNVREIKTPIYLETPTGIRKYEGKRTLQDIASKNAECMFIALVVPKEERKRFRKVDLLDYLSSI